MTTAIAAVTPPPVSARFRGQGPKRGCCHIDDTPALCLGPVAVLPEYQNTGAGSAAVRTALKAAKGEGEYFVTVLGHPTYYPRFGFTRASTHGIGLTIDVPDEAMMALTLDADHPLPSGVVRYAAPFGM